MAAMLVYTTTECNDNSIVIVRQHGGYDVKCKPTIRPSTQTTLSQVSVKLSSTNALSYSIGYCTITVTVTNTF